MPRKLEKVMEEEGQEVDVKNEVTNTKVCTLIIILLSITTKKIFFRYYLSSAVCVCVCVYV